MEINGPIFIGGLDRCGKTTLRAMLVSHPNIAIPEIGSNYWTFFYGQYGDLGKKENFERCLKAMLKYTHVTLLNPDVERIRRDFWLGEPTYARLFGLFNKQYAEQRGKPRWGDQTGLIERYADHVFSAYPGSKMIHMLRDPRDRYEASLALYPNGKGKVGGATARWLYTIRLAKRNLKRYPGRYMIVHYETLVREPERILREVCEFLNEEFTPDMLSMEGAVDFREKLIRRGSLKPGESLVSPDYIGLFRQRVPKEDIAFMQSVVGTDMAANNYALEPIRLSGNQRLKYYLRHWPVELGRMLAWLTVESAQQNFPSRFKRKPPASKLR